MKGIMTVIVACLLSLSTQAQELPIMAGNNEEALKVIYINKDVSTHIIMMEDIKFVDISVDNIAGDIATENTLRIKPIEEGASGVITIITERYLVQYLLVYETDLKKVYTRLNVPYNDLKSYMNPETNITKSEMYDFSYRMFVSKNKFYDVTTKVHKLKLQLNNIYTMDKYFFVDLSLLNKSNIDFDIENIVFRIEDKKQSKTTNIQAVQIIPLMELQKNKSFKKSYRNIFVFEKFTFPDEKVFSIEISEKQISGRTITLRVAYTDVLNADVFVE